MVFTGIVLVSISIPDGSIWKDFFRWENLKPLLLGMCTGAGMLLIIWGIFILKEYIDE